MKVIFCPLRSSNISGIGYKGSTLYIAFKNGRFYRYKDVPWPRFTQMLEADSAGRFFCQHIKPSYLFGRIEHDPFEYEAIQ